MCKATQMNGDTSRLCGNCHVASFVRSDAMHGDTPLSSSIAKNLSSVLSSVRLFQFTCLKNFWVHREVIRDIVSCDGNVGFSSPTFPRIGGTCN